MKLTNITKIGIASVLCSASLLATVPATPAQAAEVDGPKVKWLFSLWGGRRGFTEGIEGLAEYVSEKTDGNFEISLQYGAVLSPANDNLDGLYIGAFEAAAFCALYDPTKAPVLGGLDLPFLPVETLEQRRRVVEDYYRLPAVQEEFGKWNSVPLMGILMTNYEVMGTGEGPDTLSKWKGMRVSSTGGVGQLMSTLGASVTVVSAPDMFQAMERGMIDASTFPYTYAFAAYRLHEVSDWVTDNWSMGSMVCHAAANKDAYDALPDQYKALLKEAAQAGYQHQIAEYVKVDEKNEAVFEARGLTRVPLNDEIREALAGAAQPLWDAWVESTSAKGYPARELLAAILTSAAKAE